MGFLCPYASSSHTFHSFSCLKTLNRLLARPCFCPNSSARSLHAPTLSCSYPNPPFSLPSFPSSIAYSPLIAQLYPPHDDGGGFGTATGLAAPPPPLLLNFLLSSAVRFFFGAPLPRALRSTIWSSRSASRSSLCRGREVVSMYTYTYHPYNPEGREERRDGAGE